MNVKNLIAMGMVFAVAFASEGKIAEKPNIVFLLTDDQRWDTLGCMGNKAIKTPNIDRMAEQGIVFENSFVTTSICVVSRASILSGQYMRTHGVRDFGQPLDAEWMEGTYPAIMRQAGYATGMIGKFGIGADLMEKMAVAGSFFDYWKPFLDQGEYFPEGKDGPHSTDILTGQACGFIEQSVEKGQPFCLSVSYKAPHGPWHEYNPRYENLYDGVEMPVPETFTQKAFDGLPECIRRSRSALTCASTARELRWGASFHPDHHQVISSRYYRLISGVDDSVGAIRKKLAELGVADNTILIYTSDNGHFIHDYGLYGKWLMHEPSMRVPLVVYDPRANAAKGSRRREMMLNIDHAPTLLSLCGLPIPESMQGADYSALLRGGKIDWRKDFLYEHTYGQYAGDIAKTVGVRTDGFAYMRLVSEPGKPELLFNLGSDPNELKNLAKFPEHAEMLQELRGRCDELREEFPDNNPDYDEYAEHTVLDTNRHEPLQTRHELSSAKSLAQSFRAEGNFLKCVEIRWPTWEAFGIQANLVMELYQHGRLIGRKEVDAGKNLYARQGLYSECLRVGFDAPVEKGGTLVLKMSAESRTPDVHLGWWAFDRDVYPNGAAYVDGSMKNFDFDLRVVFNEGVGVK